MSRGALLESRVRLPVVAAVVVLAASAGSAAAQTITVTFEELGQRPSSFPQTTALRTQIAGLSFEGPGPLDGGAVLDQSSNFGVNARSGRNFPEVVRFLTAPVTFAEIYVYSPTPWSEFLMEALDGAGNVLANADVTGSSTAWTRLSLERAAGFNAVRLTETSGATAFIYDDLTYTLVPAPGAAALALLGGAMALRRRR